jgi:hypothetical protein
MKCSEGEPLQARQKFCTVGSVRAGLRFFSGLSVAAGARLPTGRRLVVRGLSSVLARLIMIVCSGVWAESCGQSLRPRTGTQLTVHEPKQVKRASAVSLLVTFAYPSSLKTILYECMQRKPF